MTFTWHEIYYTKTQPVHIPTYHSTPTHKWNKNFGKQYYPGHSLTTSTWLYFVKNAVVTQKGSHSGVRKTLYYPKINFTMQPSIMTEDTVNMIQMIGGLKQLKLGRECGIMEFMSSNPYSTSRWMCDPASHFLLQANAVRIKWDRVDKATDP